MKKLFTLLLVTIAINISNAQSIQIDFENLSGAINQNQNLAADAGIDYTTTIFPSAWDTLFGGYWVNGWAWSSQTDSITSGYTNQYASASGSGDSSETYLVSYSFSKIITPLHFPKKISINNNAYAYWSMKNGDSFAKKFGGVTGTDPDYFRVILYGYQSGVKKEDSIVVYLADYRAALSTNDYIVKGWIDVPLDSLYQTDSIEFVLESSDNGSFGMNTPAYFCIDNYQYRINPSDLTEAENTFNFYPNPTTQYVRFDDAIESISVKNVVGQTQNVSISNQTIDCTTLANGVYFVQFTFDNKLYSHKFIKQ